MKSDHGGVFGAANRPRAYGRLPLVPPQGFPKVPSLRTRAAGEAISLPVLLRGWFVAFLPPITPPGFFMGFLNAVLRARLPLDTPRRARYNARRPQPARPERWPHGGHLFESEAFHSHAAT